MINVYILSLTNFEKKGYIPNWKNVFSPIKSGVFGLHHLQLRLLNKSKENLNHHQLANPIFSLWHLMFIRFEKLYQIIMKIIQRLLHIWLDLQVGQVWQICHKNFQIVENCFHHNSHSNWCTPIQTFFSLKKGFNFALMVVSS